MPNPLPNPMPDRAASPAAIRMFSLNDLLEWRAELHPDAPALIDQRDDKATYRQLAERVESCALRWRDRGVSPGDVVALLDTNSVSYFVNLFGLARLRAVPAMLNWRLTAAENRSLLDLVEPVAVAVGSDLIDRLPRELPSLRVALGRAPAGWVLDEDPPVAAGRDAASAARDLARPAPGDVFALGFSSGTTGQPKAIPMRHDSLVRSVLVDAMETAGMRRGARQLMVAPTFHLAGLANSLMGLSRGAEIHLRTGFDPAAVLADIEELAVEYLTAVPAMFRAMVQAQRTMAAAGSAPNTSSMLEMTYGASPIAPELVREIAEIFPGCLLRQFYGMTEIAGALTTLTPEDHLPDRPHHLSAGRVNPGFEVRLVDRNGVEVADGSPGQIMIRGQSVMSGYWRNPEATDEAIVDGWFASGDIAIRNDGYLTIMDRAKDMIVSGGENVYPAEVEAVLYEHPSIVDAAVIGVPNERYGEGVHAVLVASDTEQEPELTVEAVQAFCRERLAGYKLPRSVEVVAELPRNATGKILKRDLRAPYWEHVERQI